MFNLASEIHCRNESNGFLILSGESLALLLFGVMYINIFFALPPLAYHAVTLIVILLAGYKLWGQSVALKGWVVGVALIFIIPSLVNKDFKGFIYSESTLLGMSGYFVLFYNRPMTEDFLSRALWFIVLPGFVVSSLFVGPGYHFATQENTPTLIPLVENLYRINIGPWGTTVHFTGDFGLLLLVSTYFCKSISKNARILLILFSSYLVLFSGAREAYFTLFVLAGVEVLVYFNKYKLILPWVLVDIAFLYGVQFWAMYLPSDSGILGELFKTNASYNDLSSGRVWLWALHLNAFWDSPFVGIGRHGFDLLYQNWSMDTLPATSESYYTSQIAIYGVFGFIFPLLNFMILGAAIKARRGFAIALSSIAIIGTIANSSYGAIYVPFQSLMLPLLASLLRGEPFVKSS